MIYSCTHMATVGIKGLNTTSWLFFLLWHHVSQLVKLTVRLLGFVSGFDIGKGHINK